jgi:hypothetical protein
MIGVSREEGKDDFEGLQENEAFSLRNRQGNMNRNE